MTAHPMSEPWTRAEDNEAIADAIINRVCEIDRHGPSPDDQPDLMQVTVAELRLIILSELNQD